MNTEARKKKGDSNKKEAAPCSTCRQKHVTKNLTVINEEK